MRPSISKDETAGWVMEQNISYWAEGEDISNKGDSSEVENDVEIVISEETEVETR